MWFKHISLNLQLAIIHPRNKSKQDLRICDSFSSMLGSFGRFYLSKDSPPMLTQFLGMTLMNYRGFWILVTSIFAVPSAACPLKKFGYCDSKAWIFSIIIVGIFSQNFLLMLWQLIIPNSPKRDGREILWQFFLSH